MDIIFGSTNRMEITRDMVDDAIINEVPSFFFKLIINLLMASRYDYYYGLYILYLLLIDYYSNGL